MYATSVYSMERGRYPLSTLAQLTFSQPWSVEIKTIHATAPRITFALRLMTEPPANRLDPFQAAEEKIESQPDHADQQHGRHDQVVPLAGVA